MTIVVLLILAIVWAIVLVPPALRARTEGRPADSISHFHRQLSTLQRTGPIRGRSGTPTPASVLGSLRAGATNAPTRLAVAPPARSGARPAVATRTQKRRRDIFVGLLAAMAISLVLGLVPSLRILWVVHVAADALFVGYVALLVRMRNAVAEREMKLSFLPTRGAHVEAALLPLRRSS